MDLLIVKSLRSSENSNIHVDGTINYSYLNCLFLIEDINTLNDIKEQLVSDKYFVSKIFVNFFF